jgi:hypothetical protein
MTPGYVEIKQVRPGSTVSVELTNQVMILLYKTPGSAVVCTQKTGKMFNRTIDYDKVERVSLATVVKVTKKPVEGFDAASYIAKPKKNTQNVEPERLASPKGESMSSTAVRQKSKGRAVAPLPAQKSNTIDPAKQARDAEKLTDKAAFKVAKRLIEENTLTYADMHTQILREVPEFKKSVSWVSNVAYYLRHDPSKLEKYK